MLKKILAATALVCASLAVAAPTASAATRLHFAGVYPSLAAAKTACNDGIKQGRWFDCSYVLTAPSVQLWVEA